MPKARTGLVVFDRDSRSLLAEDLRSRLVGMAISRGILVETLGVGRDEIPPCIGCLDCITRHPGSCVFDRAIRPLARAASARFFVAFVASSPFGAPASEIKSVMDRGWLIVKPSSLQLVIGAEDGASDEEAGTFVDTVLGHRGAAEIIHTRVKESIAAFFSTSFEGNARVAQAAGEFLGSPAKEGGR